MGAHKPRSTRHSAAPGTRSVAELYGWVELDYPDPDKPQPIQLAMLQEFLRTASDGWELALTSARNLWPSTTCTPTRSVATSPARLTASASR